MIITEKQYNLFATTSDWQIALANINILTEDANANTSWKTVNDLMAASFSADWKLNICVSPT